MFGVGLTASTKGALHKLTTFMVKGKRATGEGVGKIPAAALESVKSGNGE